MLGFELPGSRGKRKALSWEADTFPELNFKGSQLLRSSQDEELKCTCNWERKRGETRRGREGERGMETRVSEARLPGQVEPL